MKSVLILAALFAFAAGAALEPSAQAEILRYDNDNIGLDKYSFAWETSDGKSQSEEGVLKNLGPDDNAIVVSGQYSYIGEDGVTYTVHYVADENGFQPSGDHIQKLPQVQPL